MTPIDYSKYEGIGKDFIHPEGVTFKATGWASLPKNKYHEWYVSVLTATPGYMNYGIRISNLKDEFEDGTGQWIAETIENAVNAAPVLLSACKERDERVNQLESENAVLRKRLECPEVKFERNETGESGNAFHPIQDFYYQKDRDGTWRAESHGGSILHGEQTRESIEVLITKTCEERWHQIHGGGK